MAEDFPRVMTRDELRFEVGLILSQAPRSLIRDWASTNQRKSDMARNLLRDTILARLDRYQVRSPPPLVPVGFRVERSTEPKDET
ncbi:hypothetical protein [Altericroceibacterium xinjiangense]|uniref:hypothetical protein n=1 Tax=Altericroceibacterium xinjiangense TaxID=762261 RepID=UPI000F7E7846|nr:hypothetical protein [Altericroceibacterium xinjiangense]